MRRAHREEGLRAFNARSTKKRDMDRWKAYLTALLQRLESIRAGSEEIATSYEKLSSRKDALCAVRDRLGIPILDGKPCEHCGTNLVAQYSRHMCYKLGKFVIPRLPDLPPPLQKLYTSIVRSESPEVRKESGAYNYRNCLVLRVHEYRGWRAEKYILKSYIIRAREVMSGGIISVMITTPDTTHTFISF